MKRKREVIKEKCGNKCYYCLAAFTTWGEFNIDHVVPLVLGGGKNIENLVLSCFKCNALKANYLLEDFKKIIQILLESREKEVEHFKKIITRLAQL